MAISAGETFWLEVKREIHIKLSNSQEFICFPQYLEQKTYSGLLGKPQLALRLPSFFHNTFYNVTMFYYVLLL